MHTFAACTRAARVTWGWQGVWRAQHLRRNDTTLVRTHKCTYTACTNTPPLLSFLLSSMTHPTQGQQVREEMEGGKGWASVRGDTTAERREWANRFTEKTYCTKCLLTDISFQSFANPIVCIIVKVTYSHSFPPNTHCESHKSHMESHKRSPPRFLLVLKSFFSFALQQLSYEQQNPS